MIELKGNIWQQVVVNNYKGAIWLCVTTNGFCGQRGNAIMGRGIAKEAKERFRGIDKTLGSLLKKNGNIVQRIYTSKDDMFIEESSLSLFSFPTKHHWSQPSYLELIRRSAYQLKALMVHLNPTKVFLPRPGCGNGGRAWYEVQPLLEEVGFDDSLVIVNK